jgi:hypothetical protein
VCVERCYAHGNLNQNDAFERSGGMNNFGLLRSNGIAHPAFRVVTSIYTDNSSLFDYVVSGFISVAAGLITIDIPIGIGSRLQVNLSNIAFIAECGAGLNSTKDRGGRRDRQRANHESDCQDK